MALMDVWASTQQSMSDVGRGLADEEAEVVVPACAAWTERQVQEREGRSVTEILDEWDANVPSLVEQLRPLGDDMDSRVVFDVWTHEQDVRHTVGRPGGRSGPVVDFVVGRVRAFVEGQFTEAGLAPSGVDVGDGRPDAAVAVEPLELVRAVAGRRSADQVLTWSWSVPDLAGYVAVLPAFPLRPDALEEHA